MRDKSRMPCSRMPPNPAPAAALPKPLLGWQPTTFLERGVSVPFTTPQLSGARLRLIERGGFELVVPNMSGMRGVYILGWESVPALCVPTLHDRRLNAKLSTLRNLTPSLIRRAAREVAAEGLAGREAMAAAAAAIAADEQQRLLANLELLLEVIRQSEHHGPGWLPPEHASRDDLERRARAALAALSHAMKLQPDTLTTMIEELAALVWPIGIGRLAANARVPTQIAALTALRTDMHDWQRACAEAGNPDAALVEAGAELTLAGAQLLLDEARAMLAETPKLLMRWSVDADAVVRTIGRAEWLLDGWERIWLLWQVADERVSRAATLAEMAELVPAVPREASSWMEWALVSQSEMLRHRRMVQLGEDWRTGVTLEDLVARNERVRALAPD
jgi:hypothetical protein